jgi:dTDP-4-dehydrorhamnose reductase
VLKVSADEVSIPTFAHTITNLTTSAVEKGLTGLYHLTSSGYASRYELARYFAELKGLSNLIVPVPLEDFRMPATRPRFSCLSNSKIQKALGMEISDWKLYLKEYMARS